MDKEKRVVGNLMFQYLQRDDPPLNKDVAKKNVHKVSEQVDLSALEDNLRFEKERRLRLGDTDILQVKCFQLLTAMSMISRALC